MDSNFSGIFRSIEKSMESLNEQIKAIDWDKKWQKDYPKTERAKQEAETLKKPEVKEALSEVFSDHSLVMSRLGEAF
jgi:thiamine pyrophosphate-dependent acetolactate synthase large subunit-like protein